MNNLEYLIIGLYVGFLFGFLGGLLFYSLIRKKSMKVEDKQNGKISK